MDHAIRPVREDDLPAVTAIYADAVLHGTASFELDPPGVDEMMSRWRAIAGGGFPSLVAETSAGIAGYAYAGAYRPRPAYRFTVEDSVYVHPDAKGRGVGRLLLRSLIEACTDLGMRRMVAVIGDSRSVGSIALHRSCGFEPAGVVPKVGWKHGRWLDQVLMHRALGDGDASPPL